MDKGKLKKYTWYMMLGLFGGYFGGGLAIEIIFLGKLSEIMYHVLLGPAWWYTILFTDFPFLLLFVLAFQVIGGILGGLRIKKWWAALMGGFIINFLLFFLLYLLYFKNLDCC